MEEKLRAHYKNNLHSYILMSVLFLGALVFYHTYMYYCRCGDLGLKIAAARLQGQGQEAYFYTEATGEKVINGVTSTPFLNMLHAPLVNLNSCQVKQTSFAINFIFLAGCFFFIAWLAGKTHWLRVYASGAIIFSLLLFANPFYTNLDHGQTYIMFTMLFFVLYLLLEKKQYFALGLVWAFAIAVRPIFLTGTILALLYYNRKVIAGLLTGAVLIVAITFITGTAHYWKEYSVAMKQYAYEVPCLKYAGCTEWKRHLIASMDYTYTDCKIMLTTVEANALDNVTRVGTLFPGLQAWLVDAHKIITNVNFYSAILCVVTCLVALSIRFRLKKITVEKYALLIFLLYIISEICVPAVRLRYSSFVWLFAITIMIARANFFEIILLLPGLFVLCGYHHHNYKFGEFGLFIPCLVYVLRKSETPYYVNWFIALKQKIAPTTKPAIGSGG